MVAAPTMCWARPHASFSWITAGVPASPGVTYRSMPMLLGSEGLVWTATRAGIARFKNLGRVEVIAPPLTPAPVTGLAQTPDGKVYELATAGDGSGQQVIQVAAAGASVLATLAGSSADAMVSGADGELYVAIDDEGDYRCVDGVFDGARCGPRIVRVAADGSEQAFPVPFRVNQLGPAVAGADGNIWFTMQGLAFSNLYPTEIVRMTPQGRFTAWTVDAAERIGGLAAAPGGIWFTIGSRVGRISYQGEVETFSAGIPEGSEPGAITLGPEGAMWFTELRADAIARVDAAGQITQYPWGPMKVVGPQEGEPDGADGIIAPGDGTLLAFVAGSDQFARFSPTGRCIVPQLAGLHLKAALRAARAAGCHPGLVSGIRAGVVAHQGAPFGKLLPPHQRLELSTITARSAARRCLLAPEEREILSDSEAVLAYEITAEGSVRYLLCRPGHSGPHRVRQIPDSELSSGDYGASTLFRLSGSYLAWYGEYNTKYFTHSADVGALNVTTGQALHGSGDFGEQASGATADAVDVAIDQRGDLAWHLRLSYPPAASEPCRTEMTALSCTPVRATDKIQALVAGQVVTLAEGDAQAFGGLTFPTVGVLQWIGEGREQSYTFTADTRG